MDLDWRALSARDREREYSPSSCIGGNYQPYVRAYAELSAAARRGHPPATIRYGATVLQIFRLVYLPLMMPSLVAIGTYAVLLAWNEYLYAFLLLSNDRDITLPVALGNFLAADDSPWELLMTTGFIYALPPAAVYYAFKRYMVGGLTAGAVKS